MCMINRDEVLSQLLESGQFSGCSLEEIDVFRYDFDVNSTTVTGLLMSEKGAINPDDLELYSEQQVVRVLQDLTRLKSFVEQIADGKGPRSEEATRLLNALHNETIWYAKLETR